jgi:hypothetical protein
MFEHAQDVCAVTIGDGELYFHLVRPDQTLKIQRTARTIQVEGPLVITIDEGSQGPVGVHLVFPKEKS